MSLYDEYRREHPIEPLPSEFQDILEGEVRRALEWCRGRGSVDSFGDRIRKLARTFKDARMALDMMLEGDSSCFATCSLAQECEESKTEECLWLARLEEVLASVEKPLPAEDIKPGRYLMRETIEVMVDVVQGSNGLWVRSAWTYLPKQSWSLPLEYLTRKGATFQAVEEG